MSERDETFNLGYYVTLIFKHRWLIIIPFCLAMLVGITLALVLPKTYQVSTSILIRPQQVPTDYVQSIVTADLESRIRSISQQILSRKNLGKIINQFNLFSELEHQEMPVEDKVGTLREHIVIELLQAETRQEAQAFSIYFSGPNPEEVMHVTNALATLFIDENLKKREAEAVETTEFLNEELEAMRTRLEEVELRLKDYRKLNMGELPEQLESNLRILDTLQQQLSERENRLRDESCGKPLETCFMLGSNAKYYVDNGMARFITQEDAKKIIKKNDEAGLVMQPFNSQKTGVMCSCCGDCCEMLGSLKMQPVPAAAVKSNYFATVNADECSGCETCLDRCQMEAIIIEDEMAVIDLERCIGCGLCVSTCPTEALQLVKKAENKQYQPPQSKAEVFMQLAIERKKSLFLKL